MKKTTFTVTALKGATLLCSDKDGNKVSVMPKLGHHPQVGNIIAAYRVHSLQTKVFGGRITRWQETVATGPMFWKQA
jgi:hypothetical protein